MSLCLKLYTLNKLILLVLWADIKCDATLIYFVIMDTLRVCFWLYVDHMQ
jgi:hypothetical protein